MEKNNLFAFGLYEGWFMTPNKYFCQSYFLRRYSNAVLQQQREDMIQEVSVYYDFFKTHYYSLLRIKTPIHEAQHLI